MTQHAPHFSPSPAPKAATPSRHRKPRGSVVTDARAAAQRTKIEVEREVSFAADHPGRTGQNAGRAHGSNLCPLRARSFTG